MTFRAFSIGFSAALLALACGSDDNNQPPPDVDEETPVTNVRPPDDCALNPLIAGCGNPVDNTPPEDDTDEPIGNDGDNDAKDLAEAAAKNVLNANCGFCHGGQLTPETAQAGMNYIADIDKLVDTGKIIPLDSKSSKIIQRMVDGSMPPPVSGRPAVTATDINIVASYIDNPLFWPPGGGNVDCTDQLFSYDDLFAEIRNDIGDFDEDDAATIRYISLTNRYTAGVCAVDSAALERDRQALIKMMNALSTETTVVAPEPINTEKTIYRINLEDYGWDVASNDGGVDVVDVDGNIDNSVDKWEAVVVNNPYAVAFVGEDVDDIVQDMGNTTLVPVMFADQMLDVATIGNLYYALIDVDVNQLVTDFIAIDLDTDVVANLADEDQLRAGTTKSRITRQDRMVQRDDMGVRAGAVWQSFDFLADDQNESIFEDPFGFAEGGTEVIFTLDNGMLGYIIADENDVIVEDSDILLDSNQANNRAITSVSCSGCHQLGFIPVVDEVGQIALDNRLAFGFNRDEVEQIEAVFKTPAEFATQVATDSRSFYQRAMQDLNLPIQGIDPVSFVFQRFDLDVTLVDAAGDLGVSRDFLDDNLNELDPQVGILDGARMDRDDFTALFVDSLCILSTGNENEPDPVACADAAAALLDD